MEGMTPKVRKAVFPAAGLGTRFLPATKAQPKEMLPLVDKPLIQYGVEESVRSGIRNIIIVTGRGKSAIEDHFDVSFELENLLARRKRKDLLASVRHVSDMIDVSYIRQKEALGLGHAVLRARDLVDQEPFAVVLSDDVIDAPKPCLQQLWMFTTNTVPASLHSWRSSRQISAYVRRGSRGNPGPFQRPSVRLYRVTDWWRNPPADQAAVEPRHHRTLHPTPDIFESIEQGQPGAGGENSLTDALRHLLSSGRFNGYRFEGKNATTRATSWAFCRPRGVLRWRGPIGAQVPRLHQVPQP
jgi:UTP--glucose-1-phosphate uridylyltransferase